MYAPQRSHPRSRPRPTAARRERESTKRIKEDPVTTADLVKFAAEIAAQLDLIKSAQQLLEHMRAKLAKRGTRAIQSIGRKFKIADDNRSMSLDMGEFQKAMHDFRMNLNE